MKTNRILDLWRAKQAVVAGWLSFDSAYAAELVGGAGFDAVVTDCQHGMAGHAQMLAMLQALSHTPAVPLVRVSQNNLAEINRALDAEAYGVICPLVNSVAEAVAFGRACRNPLDGMPGDRSFGPARGLLVGGADYALHANARDRRQLERVEDRQVEAGQSGVLTPTLRHVMPSQVVADEQPGASGCGVDAAHDIGRIKPAGGQAHHGVVVRTNRTGLEDAVAVRRMGLDIDRKRRPSDDDLPGRGCQLFVERGDHIACVDIGWALGAGSGPAADERNWLSKNPRTDSLTP